MHRSIALRKRGEIVFVIEVAVAITERGRDFYAIAGG